MTDGGLIGPVADLVAKYRHAAHQVSEILQGAKAGDIPFNQGSTYNLVINLVGFVATAHVSSWHRPEIRAAGEPDAPERHVVAAATAGSDLFQLRLFVRRNPVAFAAPASRVRELPANELRALPVKKVW